VRALIAGAGIGGLTAALSLHAAGIDPLVVDSASQLRPLGVGINLLPHAVRELTELGLGEELAGSGIPTAEMAHFDAHGNRIWSEPRGLALGYEWPQFSIHRGELQMILLNAVRDRLGDGAVRTGTAVEDFAEEVSGVQVRLRDRATGGVSTERADVLVGADGLHSVVRAVLHPGEAPPRWNGIVMWRGITEGKPFLSGRTLAVAGSNAALKFVAYPISRRSEERGRALINWVAEAAVPDDQPHPDAPSSGSRARRADSKRADWNRAGTLEDVLPFFADWTFGWLDVPDLLIRSPEILEYPMVDRDPLLSWGDGRVTLLGDAAHPMYPIGSNGGSQAIVDARVLAYELACARTPADALAAYEAARRETVNEIVLAARDMPADRVLHTVSIRAPEGFERIEDVLAAHELSAIAGAYRRTTLQDVAALNSRASYDAH
jgi:2-polyprenyl-6-methoxyphenol hydroxylase-like FAD-dependent oxidoreductase